MNKTTLNPTLLFSPHASNNGIDNFGEKILLIKSPSNRDVEFKIARGEHWLQTLE
jgi:hypothetical protein